MRDWKKWVVPALLLIGLVGTGIWGYGEYKVRQELQNRAESQYQKDFYELSWHIDTITGQLAQLMVSTSKEQNVLGLATLWRQSFAAQTNIGGLPLGLVSLSKTEKFLSDIGEITHALLSKATKEAAGLTDEDKEVLKQLYTKAKALDRELDNLAARVLERDLSWTEVEVATINSNVKLQDNTILDGFELLENKMEEYPELNLGETLQVTEPDARKISTDKKISKQEAVDIARKWWFSPDDKHEVKLVYEGAGDIPTYGLEFLPAKGEEESVYIDVCKVDGTVLSVMKPKTVTEINLDLSQGERMAQEFLQKQGFNNMVLINTRQEDLFGNYTFAPRQGDVILYPDQVHVVVALDNGEVTGFEGKSYYLFHRQRQLPAPTISEGTLRKMLSPNLQVELIRLALINNYWGKNVLAWEVRGSFDEEKFVIFYNAQSGSEEQFVRITPPPKHPFTLAGA